MKKCKACAEDIQDEATVCRHCGTEVNAKRKRADWFGRVISVTAILLSIVSFARSVQNERRSVHVEASHLAVEAMAMLDGLRIRAHVGAEPRIDSAERRARRANARAKIEAAGAMDGDNSDAHCAMGVLLLQERKSDFAVAELRRAIELDPKRAMFWDELGDAYLLPGKFDEAASAYRKALLVDGRDMRALNGLGRVAYLKGDSQQAVEWFQKAAKADQDNALPYYNIGYTLFQMNDLQGAEAALLEATGRDPRDMSGGNNLDAFISLAVVLNQEGKIDDAEAAGREAEAIAPGDPTATTNLAVLLVSHAMGRGKAEAERRFADTERIYVAQALQVSPTPNYSIYRLHFSIVLHKHPRPNPTSTVALLVDPLEVAYALSLPFLLRSLL